jgi:hypothetical protein
MNADESRADKRWAKLYSLLSAAEAATKDNGKMKTDPTLNAYPKRTGLHDLSPC